MAADRLLAGTPLHCSGKRTILDLAEEAQIKRWLLTHRYPNKLMAKYQAEFEAARHRSEPVKRLRPRSTSSARSWPGSARRSGS
jgi:ribonuclease BN (tRNA processing enzyme)